MFAHLNQISSVFRIKEIPVSARRWLQGTYRLGIILIMLFGLLAMPAQKAQALPFIIATIPVSGAHNSVLGVNANTDRVYIGDFDNGIVSVIDMTTNTVVATIPGLKVNVSDGPTDIAVNPITNFIYVGRTVHFGGQITLIDGSTNTASTIGGLGSHPVSLAVNAVTNRIYVANQLSNNVSVIDGSTNTVITTIGGFSSPVGVGVNPQTNLIYVGNAGGSNSLSVIDGATDSIVTTIPLGADPFRIAVNPITNRIYASQNSTNSVSVIDGSSNSVVTSVSVGTTPLGIDVNPTNGRIYTANIGSDDVSVIDGNTNTVISAVAVGDNPVGVGVNPATSRIYVTNSASNTVSVIEDITATNGKIAFESTRDGSFGQIYTMKPDGTDITRLTFTSAHDSYPVWSPDGTRIVFESTRSGDVDIYVMNADGSAQTQLTTDPAVDNQASWSPDGTKIVFGSRRSGTEDIYVMNADGTDQTQLTTDPAGDTHPVWSPDGSKIMFVSLRSGPAQIFVMNTDGSGITQLTTSGNNGGANWSPDGTKIIFYSDRDCGGCGTYNDIYVMNADGTGQTRLAFDPTYATGPAWSPDGTKILFESQRDGNYEVYMMNADGTGQTNLTNNSAVDFRANWGPRDTIPPLVNISFSLPDGQDGWFVSSPVAGTVTADDSANGGSNVTAIDCTGASVGLITGLGTSSASASLTVSAEGVNNVNCTATDSEGNTGAASSSNNTATIMLDSIAPNINILSPANGGSYLLNATVASDYNCSDDTSGVDSCSGPVANGANFDTSSVGVHSFTVNAADLAGNSAQSTNYYNVNYNFAGFLQPVDNLPILNLVKAGSAIPVKFSLGGDQGLNIFEANYPKSQQITCESNATVDGIEQTVTAGSSSLSYDPITDTYTYVWKTEKSWANTCRQLVVKLNDGTFHRANFKFK